MYIYTELFDEQTRTEVELHWDDNSNVFVTVNPELGPTCKQFNKRLQEKFTVDVGLNSKKPIVELYTFQGSYRWTVATDIHERRSFIVYPFSIRPEGGYCFTAKLHLQKFYQIDPGIRTALSMFLKLTAARYRKQAQ